MLILATYEIDMLVDIFQYEWINNKKINHNLYYNKPWSCRLEIIAHIKKRKKGREEIFYLLSTNLASSILSPQHALFMWGWLMRNYGLATCVLVFDFGSVWSLVCLNLNKSTFMKELQFNQSQGNSLTTSSNYSPPHLGSSIGKMNTS